MVLIGISITISRIRIRTIITINTSITVGISTRISISFSFNIEDTCGESPPPSWNQRYAVLVECTKRALHLVFVLYWY